MFLFLKAEVEELHLPVAGSGDNLEGKTAGETETGNVIKGVKIILSLCDPFILLFLGFTSAGGLLANEEIDLRSAGAHLWVVRIDLRDQIIFDAESEGEVVQSGDKVPGVLSREEKGTVK